MGTTTVIRPNGAADLAIGTNPVRTGGANDQSAISDNSDATYLSIIGGSSRRYPLADTSIASTALIDYIEAYGRWDTSVAGTLHFSLFLNDAGSEFPSVAGFGPSGDTWNGLHNAKADRYAPAKHPVRPNGHHWTDADIDALKIRYLQWDDSTSGTMRLYELAVLVNWYSQPTCTATAPTGTGTNAKPTVTWTFTGDGLGQSHYEIKVFTPEQYGAGGFDPDTSRPVYTSGQVISSALKQVLTTTKDGTYRIYVRAAQTLPVSNQVHWSAWTFVSYTLNRGPNAPVIQTPSDSSKFDTGAGFKILFAYSHPDNSVGISAYALKRTTDAGAAQWWNATTATWANAAEVYNTFSTADLVAMVLVGGLTAPSASGLFPVGHTYQLSMAVKDADGQASTYSPFIGFEGNGPPTVAIVEPVGTIVNTSRPGVLWTFVDPDGDTQEIYEVLVYTGVQVAAPDFLAGTTTPLWTTGQVASSDVLVPELGIDLDNNTGYSVFVRAFADGQWSVWTQSDITMVLETAAPPLVDATWDEATGSVVCVLQGRDNKLQQQDSNLEDPLQDIGLWVGSGATLTRDTAAFLDGTASLLLTSTGTGDGIAESGGGAANYMQVFAGETYTAMAWFRAVTSGDVANCRVSIRWWDVGHGLLSESLGATVASTATGWAKASLSAVAPAGAVWASMRVIAQTTAAAKHTNADQMGLFPGTVVDWWRGGFVGNTIYKLEYSSDGGDVWSTVRDADALVPDAHQRVTIADFEAVPWLEARYRARAEVEI